MFKPIGSLIGGALQRSKTPDTIIALQVRQVAGDCIKRIMKSYPKELEKQIKVSSFKNGTLIVKAPSILAAELHLRSNDIIEGINGKLKKKVVRGIRFKAS